MYTYIYKIFLYEQIIYVYTKYTRIYKYLYTPRGRRYNNTRTHARIIHLLRSHLSREKNPMKSFVKIHSLHPLRMHYIIYPQSLYIYILYIYTCQLCDDLSYYPDECLYAITMMYSGSHVYDVTRDLIATNFERCTTRNKHM